MGHQIRGRNTDTAFNESLSVLQFYQQNDANELFRACNFTVKGVKYFTVANGDGTDHLEFFLSHCHRPGSEIDFKEPKIFCQGNLNWNGKVTHAECQDQDFQEYHSENGNRMRFLSQEKQSLEEIKLDLDNTRILYYGGNPDSIFYFFSR